MRRMVTNAEIEKLGGTKLYKHTVTLEENMSGDVEEIEMVFITTSSESLANTDIYELNDFISGYKVVDGEDGYIGFVLGKQLYTSLIYYMDSYSGSIVALDTYGTTEKFLTDKVEVL